MRSPYIPTLRRSCLPFRGLILGCKKNASSWRVTLLTLAIPHQAACSIRAVGTHRTAARWKSPNCERSSQITLLLATSQRHLISKALLTSPQPKTLLSHCCCLVRNSDTHNYSSKGDLKWQNLTI